MVSHYQMTDNAAPRLMPKSSTAEIEATCGYQLCSNILSHVGRAQRNTQRLGMCDAWGLDLIPCRQMLRALAGGLYSVHGTCYSFIQLGICEKKNPSFMAINVNHAVNSSVNYHQERKTSLRIQKSKQFHEKTPRLPTEDDTSISLPRRLSRGKKKNS